MPVTEIDQIVVRDLMAPIWHKIPSTAEKAIQRLAIILRHGAAEGHDVDLQAIEKARALLGKQRQTVVSIPSAIVFSGMKAGRSISDMTMLKVLDRRGIKYRPHGFRSSFRDWVTEQDIARNIVPKDDLRLAPNALRTTSTEIQKLIAILATHQWLKKLKPNEKVAGVPRRLAYRIRGDPADEV